MRRAGIRRFTFLHALIACYVVAMFWSAPGQWLLSINPLAEDTFGRRQFLHIALAAAVVLASLDVGRQLRHGVSKRSLQLAAVAAVSKMALGLVMLAVIAALLPAVSGSPTLAALLLGLAVVVAMPTAVSAIAWTSRRQNDAAIALLATITTTVTTPITVGLLFALVHVAGRTALSGLDYQHALGVLIASLVVPGVAGILVGRVAIPDATSLAFAGRANSCLILALNYCNASLLFPALRSAHSIGPAILAALFAIAALCVLVPAAGWICSAVGAAPRQAAAMRYAITMSNTGLAIVILADASHANPWLLLTPAVFTVLQHVAATTIERAATRSRATVHSPKPAAICVGS